MATTDPKPAAPVGPFDSKSVRTSTYKISPIEITFTTNDDFKSSHPPQPCHCHEDDDGDDAPEGPPSWLAPLMLGVNAILSKLQTMGATPVDEDDGPPSGAH